MVVTFVSSDGNTLRVYICRSYVRVKETESERAYPCDEQGDEEEERHFGVSECGSVCFHGCSVIVLGDGRLRPRCHGRDFRSGAQRC